MNAVAPGIVEVVLGRMLELVVQSVEGARGRWGRTRFWSHQILGRIEPSWTSVVSSTKSDVSLNVARTGSVTVLGSSYWQSSDCR
jgi:hypothetical protein